MAISQFPLPSSGGLTNDFIVNKNNTTNDAWTLPRDFEAGGYRVAVTGSTAYDIYLSTSAGSFVGYTSGTSIVASASFSQVSILGLGTADTVAFTYNGPSTNATATGTITGAAAYLRSITPFNLPQNNDTATVVGGNFASNVEITFESGTVVRPAKSVVVGSSTALVVTRPDDLVNDLSPYSLRAVNPGITQPTRTNSNILAGTVTAGNDPTFVTASPILGAGTGVAFSTSIAVSDSDGTVINWAITAGTLPPGLSLATATGAISGTPTTNGNYTFTVRITDNGGNTNSQQYNLPVGPVFTGANSTVVGGTAYYWWTASGDFVRSNISGTVTAPYIVIAGGGGGGGNIDGFPTGGGGAGGLLFGTATFTTNGTTTVTVGGAGGGGGSGSFMAVRGGSGSNSVLSGIGTAFGGGGGGGGGVNVDGRDVGLNGGSGGGSGRDPNAGGGAGAGTAGQGTAGGTATNDHAGGGGGAGTARRAGSTGQNSGWNGAAFGAWASAVNIIYDGGFFAGGGGGGVNGSVVTSLGGLGGGGNGRNLNNTPGAGSTGSANSGGGGGGRGGNSGNGFAGGGGLVIVRIP